MLGEAQYRSFSAVQGSRAMKVLYVEDNDDDIYMLKTRLELAGDFGF
jgi:hypothetical protein